MTYATIRDGVTFDVDLTAPAGLILADARYKRRELAYVRERLEGADTLDDAGVRVIAHRLGRLTIHLDRARLGMHDRPSAQSIADYVSGALANQL